IGGLGGGRGWGLLGDAGPVRFDDAGEADVVLVDHFLHDGLFERGFVLEGGAHFLEGSAVNGSAGDADAGQGVGEVEVGEDDADGADDAGRVGDDSVGGAGDVIGAAGADFLGRSDDGLVGLFFEAANHLIHCVGGGNGAAGGI